MCVYIYTSRYLIYYHHAHNITGLGTQMLIRVVTSFKLKAAKLGLNPHLENLHNINLALVLKSYCILFVYNTIIFTYICRICIQIVFQDLNNRKGHWHPQHCVTQAFDLSNLRALSLFLVKISVLIMQFYRVCCLAHRTRICS